MINFNKIIDRNSSRYDKYLGIVNFNSETSETPSRNFCDLYKLKNLARKATYFKNPNLSCIDLFLTNCSRSFQDTEVIETRFSQQEFSKLIQNLNSNKATQQCDIPIKTLKENCEICLLYHNHNLLNNLKKDYIRPVFKNDKFLTNNYRPVTILPSFSKSYDRCIYDQIL